MSVFGKNDPWHFSKYSQTHIFQNFEKLTTEMFDF